MLQDADTCLVTSGRSHSKNDMELAARNNVVTYLFECYVRLRRLHLDKRDVSLFLKIFMSPLFGICPNFALFYSCCCKSSKKHLTSSSLTVPTASACLRCSPLSTQQKPSLRHSSRSMAHQVIHSC